jgi:glutamate-1-semialdehyde 2,1-aminomutase
MKSARESLSNEQLYHQASRYLLAGVDAWGRYHGSLGYPVYFQRGEGAYLWGVDGSRYLDMSQSSGCTILGYGHPTVRRAIEQALDQGVISTCDTEQTVELAERICDMVPCAERVRYLPSGTEATLAALRLARGHTGRMKVLLFEGHYHGMHELAYHRPKDALTDSHPVSVGESQTAGVPGEFGELVCFVRWNDAHGFDAALSQLGDELAAVMMEPVCYNSGCMPPEPGFLQHVREATARRGIVLIFDEILSGFRTGTDCMQGYYGVTPDLCTLAKAVANGVPMAVLAGKAEVMSSLKPVGTVAQSGTYSGHPFGVAAALATLDELSRPEFYPRIHALSERLVHGMNDLFARRSVRARVQGLGCRFGLYFGVEGTVRTAQDAAGRDVEAMRRFTRGCFERGIYWPTIGHAIGHAGISAAHTRADIDWALEQFDGVLAEMGREGGG